VSDGAKAALLRGLIEHASRSASRERVWQHISFASGRKGASSFHNGAFTEAEFLGVASAFGYQGRVVGAPAAAVAVGKQCLGSDTDSGLPGIVPTGVGSALAVATQGRHVWLEQLEKLRAVVGDFPQCDEGKIPHRCGSPRQKS